MSVEVLADEGRDVDPNEKIMCGKKATNCSVSDFAKITCKNKLAVGDPVVLWGTVICKP